MRTFTRLLAVGIAALALVAGPAAAEATAGAHHAAKAQRAGKAAKRAKLTRFIIRQAAAFLGMKPGDLLRQLPGHSLAQIAQAQGKSVDDLEAAIVAAFKAKLDARVAAQKLTQAQADAALARFQALVTRVVNHVFQARPGAAQRAGHALHGVALKAAAFLGLTKQQLKQQLPGHSLAQLAEAQGKSVTDLEQAMVAAVKASLDKLVASQKITQARADRILARFQDHVDELVNRVFPAR